MGIADKIKDQIERALEKLGVPKGMVAINLDHPTDLANGDYSTNVAFLLARQTGAANKDPTDLAAKAVVELKGEKNEDIADITVAEPGFINFHLSKTFFSETIAEILEKTIWYGKNTKLWNKKIIIEHTNLNPFKPFHIGHIVNNAVGESLSRIIEFQDAKLTRASYGGDVGLHVAKTLWGMKKLEAELPREGDVREKIDFMGRAYVLGNEKYESDKTAEGQIKELNKKIFDKNDAQINDLYEWGRQASLNYFETLYRRLNSRFDYHFYESEVSAEGIRIVKSSLDRGILKESDGAVIFPGEEYGLHSRVFLTSQGLPTYEAKELGLTKKKFELHDYDQSIVVTATEQNEYFRVVLKALSLIYPEIAVRMKHLGHGFLRLPSGKMSSRAGNAITGESLISDIEEKVIEKMRDREMNATQKKETVEKVALAAIRYSILRQSVGKDIVFDANTSISFDGDSGPYLQYAYVRAKSVLRKAAEEKIKASVTVPHSVLSKTKTDEDTITRLSRLLYRFPEIVERAAADFAPNHIATFLIEVAGEFNSWYAGAKIVDKTDPQSPYKVALTEAASFIIKNGLHLLGIDAPEKM